jgi:tetratricopeptide (TPR) repeat protein
LAAVVAVAALGVVARATDEDPRERQGRALYAKGQYQEALDIYAELFAEKGDPLYMRNIGRCNQKLRRPDKAIDAFRDYLRRAHKIKPAEREEIEGYIKEMQDLKAQMDRQAADRKAAEHEAAEREERDQAHARKDDPSAGAAATTGGAPPALEGTDAAGSGPASEPASRGATAPDAPESASPSAPAAGRSERGAFFVALSVGSGFGFASGSGELNPNHTLAAPGFAIAQVGHLAPELGVFVTRHLLLSAQLRLQYVDYVSGQYLTGVCGPGENYCESSALALAAFGRVAWLTGDGALHFLGGLAVGGGNIRHAVLFGSDATCGTGRDTTCVDTLASGPFLFGPSVGLLMDLSNVVGLIAEINTQIGVPKFTLNFDLNVGVTFRP